MKAFDSISDKFLPLAMKISQNKYLIVLRDAFTRLLPIIITGSIFSIFSGLIFNPNGAILGSSGINLGHLITGLSGDAYMQSGFVEIAQKFQFYCNIISSGTVGIFSIFLVVLLAEELANLADVDKRGAIIVSLANFFILTPQFVKFTESNGDVTNIPNAFSMTFLSSSNVLFSLFITIVSVKLFSFFNKKKTFSVKLPDAVPPSVSQSFETLFPTVFTIAIISLIGGLLHFLNQPSLSETIYEIIQKPFMGFSQGLGFALIYKFFSNLFWWFGIHGSNILAPISNAVYIPAQLANQSGTGHYIFTDGFFAMLFPLSFSLAIAVILFSKRDDYKAITKVAMWPALFNIGEPLVFGIPTMLNPIFLIPTILAPFLGVIINFLAISSGLVPIIKYEIPGNMPVFFAGLIATGSIRGGILQLVVLVMGVLVYAPFVLLANKMVEKEKEIKE